MTSQNKNKSTLLLSTAYFPPAIYFALIIKHQSAVIESKETYYKQTYRNRCEILTANGKLNLTIPVTKPDGNSTTTSDILIFNNEKWFLMHKRAIQSAYRGSPFFLYYWDYFEDIFSSGNSNLLETNTEILTRILKILKINVVPTFTDNYIQQESIENDYRTRISPKALTSETDFPEYIQVFSDRYGFMPNLSILDVIFNLGPESFTYLEDISKKL